MMEFQVGSSVGIPCDIGMGPFPDEFLVTINAPDEVISGFVSVTDIARSSDDDDKGFVRAVVQAVSENTVTVVVSGSFFTTTGIAYFPLTWAGNNLQEINI